MYLQDRMNYELRAVGFNYSRSILSAKHMRQVGPLQRAEGYRHCVPKLDLKPQLIHQHHCNNCLPLLMQRWQQSMELQYTFVGGRGVEFSIVKYAT